MWKIVRLFLKNFAPVYSGLHKHEIEIDLSNCDKKINIFIGKMGSGKTAIMGHLQPFATYGTLDSRNQDDQILAGEDGIKEIDYIHDNVVYQIQHKYTWNKGSGTHSTKSYIKKNGVELNENGNVRSFKEIIKVEFGIDQSFLVLLRIGSNVSNLLKMKSTERKSFIASLRSDTEVYISLYKKLSEEYRGLNTTLSVLSNKLNLISEDKEVEMKMAEEEYSELVDELGKNIDEHKDSISRLKGGIDSITGGKSKEEIERLLKAANDKITTLEESIADIEKTIATCSSTDINEVTKELVTTSFEVECLQESIMKLQMNIEENRTKRNRLQDVLLLRATDTHMQELQMREADMRDKYEVARRKIAGFTCAYSYKYLTSLPSMLETFQMSLEEISAIDKNIIHTLYRSDGSVVSYANKKIEILRNMVKNVMIDANNEKYAIDYMAEIPMFTIPGCPSKKCPYYSTHPITRRRKRNEVEAKKRIEKLLKKQNDLEMELAKYETYVEIYPKIVMLKKTWATYSHILDELGVLMCADLLKVLTNFQYRTSWYDYNTLINVTERAYLLESFSTIENQYLQIQNELMQIRSEDAGNLESDIDKLDAEHEEFLRTLEKHSRLLTETKEKEKDLNYALVDLQNVESMKETLLQKRNELGLVEKDAKAFSAILERISSMSESMVKLSAALGILNQTYAENSQKLSTIRNQLLDIKSTRATYNDVVDERNTLKLIMEASSSKDGIPLIMVKLFLDECKDIVNDLIADIFEDELEILDFDISEETNEFKIPYSSNGIHIADVESASQGQQAIISLALSFALCRKSMFDYNIPLLDEVDNSIYKTAREKFITILFRQMEALGTEQVFLVTHSDIFQQSGLPVNIIMTTPEVIDVYPNQSVMQL